jgi:DNA polymerase (family 10)
MKSDNNKQLAKIFKEMSSIYQYMGGNDRFRALAYGKAAKVIGSLGEDISVDIKNNTLDDLPGIGEGISEKIKEFIATGKIKKFEELKKSTPYELMSMMEVRGFGPQSLKRIHDELKISTKQKLIRALEDGTVAKMKRFGQKKVENMLRGLKLHKTIEDRMLLWDALEVGEKIVNELKKMPEVKQAELAGSLRRKQETIGDIDVLVSCEEKNRKKIADHFSGSGFVKQVLAKGNTKVSILLKDSGRQVDLRIVSDDEWGAALLYFTGSKAHNIHLRAIAKEKGYKISEYGIFGVRNNEKVAGNTEEEIYKMLGFRIVPPEMREDRGEIELASKNKIPKLVSLGDIKGDLQMHTVWSDGMNTIEDIANYIIKNLSYEYIALTDHSKSSRVANGMNEKQILKQINEIKKVNKKLGRDFVKAGIEVDILADGSLDISDEVLSQLDWVTASIHSVFNKDNTQRIIRASENPYVNCIGHPTGRLIGTREPYALNMEEIITAAKKNNIALEINAQPNRMDLNDELASLVRKNGVPLVISTDSHSLDNFHFMKLGVFIAQRAWCSKNDVLNTRSWSEIEKFKKGSTRSIL